MRWHRERGTTYPAFSASFFTGGHYTYASRDSFGLCKQPFLCTRGRLLHDKIWRCPLVHPSDRVRYFETSLFIAFLRMRGLTCCRAGSPRFCGQTGRRLMAYRSKQRCTCHRCGNVRKTNIACSRCPQVTPLNPRLKLKLTLPLLIFPLLS